MAGFHVMNDSGALDRLLDTLTALHTKEEYAALLEDLCTIKELQDMAQRLQVAFLLSDGMSYQKIVEKTGVSSATITRVNRCLSYGSGGYRQAIAASKTKPQEEQA